LGVLNDAQPATKFLMNPCKTGAAEGREVSAPPYNANSAAGWMAWRRSIECADAAGAGGAASRCEPRNDAPHDRADANVVLTTRRLPTTRCPKTLSARKDNAAGAADLDDLTRRGERSVALIDAKGDDRVGVLVGGVKKGGRRVECEEARSPAMRRYPVDRGQGSVGTVDCKDDDTVVTAVRAINKTSGWRDRDLSAGIVTREARRRGRSTCTACRTPRAVS